MKKVTLLPDAGFQQKTKCGGGVTVHIPPRAISFFPLPPRKQGPTAGQGTLLGHNMLHHPTTDSRSPLSR